MKRRTQLAMAKANQDKRLEAGRLLLVEWGVSDAATVEQLEPLLGRDAAADLAVVDRLGRMPNEASARVLQLLQHVSTDKALRKAARLGLYKFQQAGVAIPAAPGPAPPVATATPLEGYLSPVDGRGDQMVWLVKPRTGGVAHLFAVINDPEGMREAELNLLSRKALRALRQELMSKHEIRLVEADWRYCDFLLQRAFDWARSREASVRGDYPNLRRQLTREQVNTEQPPLILAQLSEDVVAPADLVAASAELLKEKEFRTWFISPETLRPFLDELTNVRDSPLVLDRVQQEERARSVVEHAVEGIFAGELRDSWVRRIYEMAYVFWASARRESAKTAVAVARALADPTTGAKHIPFCADLVQVSLSFLFEATANEEEERSESSLVLTPQQIRSQMDPRRR